MLRLADVFRALFGRLAQEVNERASTTLRRRALVTRVAVEILEVDVAIFHLRLAH